MKKNVRLKTVFLSIALLFIFYLSEFMKPTIFMSSTQTVKIEEIIPNSFSGWKVDSSIIPLEISPELKSKLEKTYNQTLSRTYINKKGYRIMLSIAYGGNQSSDSTQVHRPEFCYTSQGFKITNVMDGSLVTNEINQPIRKLVATLNERIEPITYWVTIGRYSATSGIGRKLLQIKYGLLREVPDGFLVRVSSIDSDKNIAYQEQANFIVSLYSYLSEDARLRLFGSK